MSHIYVLDSIFEIFTTVPIYKTIKFQAQAQAMPVQSNMAQQQPQTTYPTLSQGNDQREANLPYPLHPTAAIVPVNVYPELGGYMGLEFNEQTIRDNMPEYLPGQQVAIPPPVSVRSLTYLC